MKIFYDANRKEIVLPENKEVSWRVSGYAIARWDEEMLVVKSFRGNLFELPGGNIDVNESIEEGLKRNCLEETGYSIKLVSDSPFYIGEEKLYHHSSKEFNHTLVLVYRAELLSKNQKVDKINPGKFKEIEKVKWIPVSYLGEKDYHYIFRPAINKLKIQEAKNKV